MNKINLRVILAIIILLYSAISFSQTTTTITYDATSNLSTTKYNVFNPSVNVGGRLHTGVIGGATFSTAKGLNLLHLVTLVTPPLIHHLELVYSQQRG